MLITILATAVVLGVLIFVHELGHFMTAKWADIEVPRFSIGFGPKVIGFKRGETEYVISLLPLGGYVKMAGMEEMEGIEGGSSEAGSTAASTPAAPRAGGPRDFESKSLPARALVISAGVLMNLLFAFVTFSVVGMIWGVRVAPEPVVGGVREDLLPIGAESLATLEPGTRIVTVGGREIGDFTDLQLQLSAARPGPLEIGVEGGAPIRVQVPETDSARAALALSIEPVFAIEARVISVVAGEPAAQAGMEDGDLVVAAAGRPVERWQSFVSAIEASPGLPVVLTVERDGARVDVTVVPRADTLPNGRVYGRIGVQGPSQRLTMPRERQGVLSAVGFGVTETWRWVRLTLEFLGGMFSGRQSARDIGGPLLIGQISGEVARAGAEAFLNFMALLSVNLAVLNLLPIPVLDGGHLVFLLIEGVRGRALSLQQRMRLTQVGMVLILALMAFAIGNDVLRLIGR